MTDEKISVLTSEGQGRGQKLFVRVRNESSNFAKKHLIIALLDFIDL